MKICIINLKSIKKNIYYQSHGKIKATHTKMVVINVFHSTVLLIYSNRQIPIAQWYVICLTKKSINSQLQIVNLEQSFLSFMQETTAFPWWHQTLFLIWFHFYLSISTVSSSREKKKSLLDVILILDDIYTLTSFIYINSY